MGTPSTAAFDAEALQMVNVLNEVAHERLRDGIDLYTLAYDEKLQERVPRYLRVRVNRETLQLCLQIMLVCRAFRLPDAELPHSPDDWHHPSTLDASRWTCHVDKDGLWWTANLTNAIEGCSVYINLEELCAALMVRDADRMPTGYGMYGGALAASCTTDAELKSLIELLQANVPKLVAKERELQMAKVVDESAGRPSRQGVMAARRPPSGL